MRTLIVVGMVVATSLSIFAAGAGKKSGASSGDFVKREIKRGKAAIVRGDVGEMLRDPYVVSCLYYSDHFYGDTAQRYSPQGRILFALAPLLTPEVRDEYIAGLKELEGIGPDGGTPGAQLVQPLDRYLFAASKASHNDAIDLFATEASTVYSMSRGIVVLAEDGWEAQDRFRTVSERGGNEVIVFDPENDRFFRYCHLGAVTVKPLDIVGAGKAIGFVGSTGLNASRSGHGEHLHLEVNRYDKTAHSIHACSQYELSDMLSELGSAR